MRTAKTAKDAKAAMNHQDRAPEPVILQPDTVVARPFSPASPFIGLRIASVDVFRGATIAAMILVNNLGDTKTSYAPLLHASWNGCTPTDWIFPFFLFVVGVSMAFSFPRRRAAGESDAAILRQAVKRSLILFGLGLIVNTFPFYNVSLSPFQLEPHARWETFRIPGVLQRIAICYLIASAILLKTGPRGWALWGAGVLLSYWAILAFLPVPGYGAGMLSAENRGANVAAWVDRLLAESHLGNRAKGTVPAWDATGLFGSWPGVANVLAGALAGAALVSARAASRKIFLLAFGGGAAALAGWLWGGRPGWTGPLTLGEPSSTEGWVFPINKPLWTSSYVLWSTGLAAAGLALCYAMVDVAGWTRWTRPFVAFGMNSILAFFGSCLLKRALEHIRLSGGASPSSLQKAVYQGVFLPAGDPYVASFLFAAATALFWWLVMEALYRRRWFWKI